MERISAEELREGQLLSSFPEIDQLVNSRLCRAAYTIEEMDKDIAVYEHQIQEMQRQFGLMQREERDE